MRPIESFPRVAEALASLTEKERHVALVRLAMVENNGDEHFDHSPVGYSWLCLACAIEGQANRLAFFVDFAETALSEPAPVSSKETP